MNRFWKGYDYVFYRTYLHYKKNRQKWYYRFFVKQDEEHGFQTFFVGIIVAHLAFIFLGIYLVLYRDFNGLPYRSSGIVLLPVLLPLVIIFTLRYNNDNHIKIVSKYWQGENKALRKKRTKWIVLFYLCSSFGGFIFIALLRQWLRQ